MRFSLIPREVAFFDMLDEAAASLTRAAGKFLDMFLHFDNLSARGKELKAEEEKCDVIIERIIKALDRSFITPLDREDIHTLATKIDDVLDNMEETAHRFVVFRIEKPTQASIDLAHNIHQCCLHLEQAISLCRNLRKPEEIQHHLLEIIKLENDADRLYREVDAAMFANGPTDILTLIKWRELYAWLEETVDACKGVAQIISEIVIKGT